MTNDEMIRWADLEVGDPRLDALIWIVRMEERARVWGEVKSKAQVELNAALLSGYPGAKKNEVS